MSKMIAHLRLAVVLAVLMVGSFFPQGVVADFDNDGFANATEITSLPFYDTTSSEGKTIEPGEPVPEWCMWPDETITWSVWYKITPSGENTYSLDVSDEAFAAVYMEYPSGDLELWDCVGMYYPEPIEFDVFQYTYYIQVSGYLPSDNIWISLDQGLSLTADFKITSSGISTSIFDTLTFQDTSFDPQEAGIQSYAWDFGDGTTETNSLGTAKHRYSADGDYTATLTITTIDGRSASASKPVSISTHDVVITRIDVPGEAKAGQTRRIDVYVANLYQPEVVYLLVEKYPGEYGGRVILQSSDAGYQTQLPVTTLNKPMAFSFEYTFTPWDAEVGKVTFVAKFDKMMWEYPFYDCSPYDDELRSAPVRVNK